MSLHYLKDGQYDIRWRLTADILGRCNCSFPDPYLQQIIVPGSPIIQIEEKTMPVPVFVIKEIEVCFEKFFTASII